MLILKQSIYLFRLSARFIAIATLTKSRVDEAIENIDREIEHHHQRGVHQDHAHHESDVLTEYAVDEVLADARHRKDFFDNK